MAHGDGSRWWRAAAGSARAFALVRPPRYFGEWSAEKHPVWRETVCAENNHHVVIGTENYFLSAEGYLMPAKKDQPPPDLRYFNKARK
jgi:hypothetical protein